MAVTENQILDALSTISDPDRGGDIVSLGMVSGIAIRDGNVAFSIEVEPERGPRLDPLRKAAERAVDALPGVLSVTAVLTAQASSRGRPGPTPAGRSARGAAAASEPAGHPAQRPQRGAIPGVGAIIAVASGKGGVGKSTVAANLALGLKAHGLSVGVLDADIYGPSMPRMLGISGRPRSRDGKTLQPMENYGLRVMSMGFLVPEDTPMIWRGPMVMSALQQMLREVEWGALDIMVVDMPPGNGRRTTDDGAASTARRCRHSLDAARHRPIGRPQGTQHVPQGRCPGARHHREYELFPLPTLRRPQRDLFTWRRPP